MARPTKLHLILNETHPSQRLNSKKPNVRPLVVEDMPHMANFVYNYYMERVKAMKELYNVSVCLKSVNFCSLINFFDDQQTQKKWQKPGQCEVQSHEYFVSKHPGEDRDTDSEDEGEREQLPVLIQDEVVAEVEENPEDGRNDEDLEMVEDNGEDANDGNREDVGDTGEVENDE